MIRVLLVDDQQLVRTGLARILRPKMGFEVVGECEDGDQVEQAVDELKPDVVVMDVRMRRMDGAEATRRLRERAGGDGAGSPPVLVLTTYDDDEVLAAALRAGAAGFQLKDAPGEDLLRSVRVVAEGGSWLDPGVTGRVLAAYRVQSPPPMSSPAAPAPSPEELTARESEVLKLIGRGVSNAEIAEQLVVSEVTVKTHIGHIFMKLALRDRAAAIVYAFDHGLVRPVDR
jgi:DNA-binding NarL/FixJ family response regulator